MRSRPVRSLALSVLAALGFAASSFGALSISTPGTAGFSVALDGADQTPVYQIPVTVTANGQGSQNGWNLSGSATQFVNGSYTFPTTASQVLSVTPPASCSGGNCSLPSPSGSVVYPVTLPNSGGAAIYNSTAGTGQGTNVITVNVQVATPANVYAGTYTSTVTLQVAAGP